LRMEIEISVRKALCSLILITSFMGSDFAIGAPPSSDSGAESGSSRHNRENSSYTLGIEASLLLIYGFNFSAGYIVSPDTMIEIYRETSPIVLFTNEPDRGYMSGLKFRFFFGNSFNVALSPYYRLIDMSGNAPRNHVGVSTSIGNRWQWENTYFGLDWLGAATDRRVVSGKITNKESGFPILFKFTFGAAI